MIGLIKMQIQLTKLMINGVIDIMSRCMRKQTIYKYETKGADQLCAVTAQMISVFVFATHIVKPLFFLNLKFQASSLYRPV